MFKNIFVALKFNEYIYPSIFEYIFQYPNNRYIVIWSTNNSWRTNFKTIGPMWTIYHDGLLVSVLSINSPNVRKLWRKDINVFTSFFRHCRKVAIRIYYWLHVIENSCDWGLSLKLLLSLHIHSKKLNEGILSSYLSDHTLKKKSFKKVIK